MGEEEEEELKEKDEREKTREKNRKPTREHKPNTHSHKLLLTNWVCVQNRQTNNAMLFPVATAKTKMKKSNIH